MEEASDVPPRVGVHRSVDDPEVRLLWLHRRPAANRAGSLSTVLRKQQVSVASKIVNREIFIRLNFDWSLKLLFRKPYSHYNNFLDEVYNYETDLEENRISLAHQIFSKYLTIPQGEPQVDMIPQAEETL